LPTTIAEIGGLVSIAFSAKGNSIRKPAAQRRRTRISRNIADAAASSPQNRAWQRALGSASARSTETIGVTCLCTRENPKIPASPVQARFALPWP